MASSVCLDQTKLKGRCAYTLVSVPVYLSACLVPEILVIAHLFPVPTPSAQGSFAYRRCYLLSEVVFHISESITSLSSLLRPHAPVPRPLSFLCYYTYKNSLCRWSPPGWLRDFPVVISALLFLDARTPTPALALVHLIVSSQSPSAFPNT